MDQTLQGMQNVAVMPRRIRGATIRRRRTFLREWREHIYPNLSQDEIAGRFDMSAAQLSRIERGLSPYTQDFLELAAHAYGTDPGILLSRRPQDMDLWETVKKIIKSEG